MTKMFFIILFSIIKKCGYIYEYTGHTYVKLFIEISKLKNDVSTFRISLVDL